jgi:hypothetical protein
VKDHECERTQVSIRVSKTLAAQCGSVGMTWRKSLFFWISVAP